MGGYNVLGYIKDIVATNFRRLYQCCYFYYAQFIVVSNQKHRKVKIAKF